MDNNSRIMTSEFSLSTIETDIQGKMKLGALCNRMQEIAWQDAARNGFGYDELKDQNLMWMLSRIQIEIKNLPVWRQTVRLSTWAKKVESLFAIRDFILEDANGNTLCSATSSWIVIDPENRRLKRPEAIGNLPASFTDKSAINETAPKLKKPDNPVIMKKCCAEYCDLDLIGHLNNTIYVDWVQNSFSIEKQKNQSVKTFKINFLSEVLGGNELSIYGSEQTDNTNTYLLEGRNTSKEDISFRAEVEWA